MKEETDVRMTILVPPEMFEFIDELAKENKVSRSYIIRAAIQEYMNSFDEEE